MIGIEETRKGKKRWRAKKMIRKEEEKQNKKSRGTGMMEGWRNKYCGMEETRDKGKEKIKM